VLELDLLLAAAVQHDLLLFRRELVPRRLDIDLVRLRERLNELEVVDVAAVPAADRAVRERQVAVMDDARGIEKLLHAQSRAGGARASRIVEGEQARLELRNAVAADLAGEAVREHERFALRLVHEADASGAVRQAQRRFERLGQALRDVRTHLHAIDDGFDRVLAFRVELWRGVELDDVAVDARADESLPAELFDDLCVLALALVDQR